METGRKPRYTIPPKTDHVTDYEIRSAVKWTTYRQPTEKDYISQYLPKLRAILEAHPIYRTCPEASEIFPRVYLGTVANAEDRKWISRMGITHVVNCSGHPWLRAEREMVYHTAKCGVKDYMEIAVENSSTYDILHHFVKTFLFIDRGRCEADHRVLIYCSELDPSGAVAIGYLIHRGFSLLQAVKMLKFKRGAVLFNQGFMKQLIVYAMDRGQIKDDDARKHHLMAETLDILATARRRLPQSHLMTFV